MQIHGGSQIPAIPGIPGLCSLRTKRLPISSRDPAHSSALIFSFHKAFRSRAQSRSSLPRDLALCRLMALTTRASSQRFNRETRGPHQSLRQMRPHLSLPLPPGAPLLRPDLSKPFNSSLLILSSARGIFPKVGEIRDSGLLEGRDSWDEQTDDFAGYVSGEWVRITLNRN